TRIFSLYRESPSGHYWNFGNPEPRLDGVTRLLSYRVVHGFPLIVAVGLAESDIFAEATSTIRKYYLMAFTLNACVIGAVGIGARRKEELSSTMVALEQSKQSLEQVNLWFNTALKNMVQGLSMYDKDQRLILSNDRHSEIYGIEQGQLKLGMRFSCILK